MNMKKPLLSSNPSNSPSTTFRAILICTAFFAVVAFAFLSVSTFAKAHQTTTLESTARPLSKLKRPVVILISADGFRFGYQHKIPTPNIHRLITKGTEAETGLIPVFPTLTFPNHYSIATGLYPAYHSIVSNRFTDPIIGKTFMLRNREPYWWLGEPLWQTVVKHGLKAAVYFWPGGDVNKGSWDCPPKFCPAYNGSTPFEERVDTVLSYFDLPSVKSMTQTADKQQSGADNTLP